LVNNKVLKILPTVTVSVEIGLFDLLNSHPDLNVEELSKQLQIGLRGLNALLVVLTSLKFLNRRKEKYQLSELAKVYLVSSSKYYWAPRFNFGSEEHQKLKQVISSDKPIGNSIKEWESFSMTDERAKTVTREMHVHSFPAAIGFSQNFDLSKTHKMLDVAGGSGCYSIAACIKNPSLKSTVLEIPSVCKAALEYVHEFNLKDQVDTISANMFEDDWPLGYDAHFFSNIFHDWGDQTCKHLAQKSFKTLNSGGKILLHEMLLNDNKDGPLTTAAFSIHMLLYAKGKQFTFQELEDILQSAGFKEVKATHSYSYYSVVSAIKP